MTERRPIPKRTRFEVFKRDKFTCQYCGKSAPDVVLQVDHVIPVSKGGTNEIMNLVTSCLECNLGKSNVELNDDSAIKVMKKQIDELAERRQQIEMMYEWQRGLIDTEEFAVGKINELVHELFGVYLSENGLKSARSFLKKYGFEKTAIAYRIAESQYGAADPEYAIGKVGGILYNRSHRTAAQCRYRGYGCGNGYYECENPLIDGSWQCCNKEAEKCPDYESRYGDWDA